VGVANRIRSSARLGCLLVPLKQRLVNVVDPFLLFLVLGHFLRSYDTCQLVDLIGFLRLFIAEDLLESCHGVLHLLYLS